MSSAIAVIGATGAQGGSVARSLMQNPRFEVRAITRNPDSEASKALAAAGARVVQADTVDKISLLKAFNGCTGAYVNLNSADKSLNGGSLTEFDVGKIIVDAAIEAGIQHFVLSSGPPCVEMTGGKVKLVAMDMKYRIETYIRNVDKFDTFTAINAAWYFENFTIKEIAPLFGGFPFVPDTEGVLTFKVPYWGGDNTVPFVSIVEDYGDIVHGIFLDPMLYNGRVIHGASDIISFEQLTADFESVTGKKSRFEPVLPTWEAFEMGGSPELDDVKLMFGFAQETGGLYFSKEPSEVSTASELKRAAAVAQGKPVGEQGLVSAKEWFRKNFT